MIYLMPLNELDAYLALKSSSLSYRLGLSKKYCWR